MSRARQFLKENFVLLVGLTLPVLLMLAFLAASNLPQTLAEPPKYDLVFAVRDYASTAGNLPFGVRLVVKDHALVAQYTKLAPPATAYTAGDGWRRLYLYEAAAGKVRELTFGLPADPDKIEGMREEAVEATKGLRLDTTLQSPDGYELSRRDTGRGGLLTDVFWGSSYENRPCLRKGSSCVALASGDGRASLYYSGTEFIGWVVPESGGSN